MCRFAADSLFMDIQNNCVRVCGREGGGGGGEGRRAGVGSEVCKYSERLSQKVKQENNIFLPSKKGRI